MSSSPYCSRQHLAKRIFVWLSLSAVLLCGLGGCGAEISFTGAECISDLELMSSEGQPRLGCLVFSHDKVARAVAYFPSSDGAYWQLYYCANTSLQTCEIGATPVKLGKVPGADETAVVAFPPVAEAQQFTGSNAFLSFCASLFSPTQPRAVACQNNGKQTTADQLRNCWVVLHYKYNRGSKQGTCSRWVQN